MAQAMTPAQLAEAPPNSDPTHPAVAGRIISEMRTLRGWIDRLDAATLASDDGWEALEELGESVEAARREAELHRPHVP